MEETFSLIVHGAAGRMGRRVVALASQEADCALLAAVEHEGHPELGQDAGRVAGIAAAGVPLTAEWPASDAPAVVIDFSLPTALSSCLQQCLDARRPLVVATTGLDAGQQETLRRAAAQIPIVWAPSMSLAVNLCMRVSQQIAAALRDVNGGVDVEILERHHRFKADAPSGTALRFGELIAQSLAGSGDDAEIQHVHGRQGHTGQRQQNQIGYHAVRTGDNPGEHTIVFGMLGETVELKVAASNRDCYAAGALAAAKWLTRDKTPGLYNMFDVLGFSQSPDAATS